MYPDNNDPSLIRIADIISKNNSGIIVVPGNPSTDTLASATSLYLGLLKAGKNMTIVSPTPATADLAAADKIQNDLNVSGDNLVVSFPYVEGAIDKVDYNIQGGHFNLIVSPRAGFPKLDPSQVKYLYSGGLFQFIIVIDAPSLSSLGQVYSENQSQFQGKEIINIDRHLTNGYFGTVNLVNKTSSSLSEIVFKIIQFLKLEIDKDMATNLYVGISTSTNNFTSYSVTADTFDTISRLLRMGAVKKAVKKPVASPSVPFMVKPPKIFTQSPSKTKEVISNKPIESVEKETQVEETPAPQDWLKPKIFRSGGLI
jgi:nanoRNase/pAp phosphatase (c-di-AMP/oligoRNAs hydrolase)